MQFRFADHVLDVARRELRRHGQPVALEPQVFDLLVHLIRNRDHVVSKDDLIGAVWGGRIVSDSTLTSRINATRKAVGDNGKEQKLIRTIARKGFRFLGKVSLATPEVTDARMADQGPGPARPALPDRPAIAVLPFTNMTGDPAQDYF